MSLSDCTGSVLLTGHSISEHGCVATDKEELRLDPTSIDDLPSLSFFCATKIPSPATKAQTKTTRLGPQTTKVASQATKVATGTISQHPPATYLLRNTQTLPPALLLSSLPASSIISPLPPINLPLTPRAQTIPSCTFQHVVRTIAHLSHVMLSV